MNAKRISVLSLWLLSAAAFAAQAAPSLRVSPLGYQVTQVQAVPGQSRTYDVTSRVGITNQGDPARDVTATLTSRSASFVVFDGVVQAGNVPRTPLLRPFRSPDTFTIRVTVPRIMNLLDLLRFMGSLHEGLSWHITCANCGQTNRPPLANAGADQSVYVQQLVTLDASGSSDPDGDALSYQWSFVQQPAGSQVALVSATNVHPTFTPDREGEYLVQLVVRDGQLASAPDTVTISTRNSAPVANAGADRTVSIGLPVELDGSGSSDVDGDALTYVWQILQRPPGSAVALERPDEVNPVFTPDLAGAYVIELVVDDGTVSSAPDTVTLSTANSRPFAHAGADQTAIVGATVQFDGSGSSDPDGDALSFRWSLGSKPAGSASALQGETSATPSLSIDRAGTYVAQLIVNDGASDSEADTVSVSTQNSAPLAIVDGPASVHFGATVPLTGARSSDPDGDPLSFNWSLLSAPQGSAAALNDPFAIAPSFLADRPGTYVAQLIVGDGVVNSAPASHSITAQNEPPVARDDAASTLAGVAVTVDVLANDSDPDPQDTLRIESVSQPAHGVVGFTHTAITYTPSVGFTGVETLTYRVTDGAASAQATLVLTVESGIPANQAPIAALDITPASVEVGAVAQLSFARSSDPDAGDSIVSYKVTLRAAPSGSAGGGLAGVSFQVGVTQVSTQNAVPFAPDVAGSYLFDLSVVDSHGAESGVVSAALTATAPPPPPNRAPSAVLDIDPSTVEVGGTPSSATLDFSGSSDPDAGDSIARHLVTLLAAPTGSTGGTTAGQRFTLGVALETTASALNFVPDVAGTYRFQLIVHDQSGLASGAVAAELVAVDPAPTGEVASLEIDKASILLTGPGQSAKLNAQALDSQGLPIQGALTWFSSSPADITVDTTGRITAQRIGSALVYAEAGGKRSMPSFIIVAEPQPGALMVPDSQVISVGVAQPLSEGEIAGVGMQYEARLAGLASLPAVGTVVVATETAQIGGKVVAARYEGDVAVITLALAPLYELLARYHIDWDVDLSVYPIEAIPGQEVGSARPAARTFATLDDDESPIRPFERFECNGEARASLTDNSVSLTPNNAMRLVVADYRDNPLLPPGYVKRALTGTMTLDGRVGIIFKANINASGECLAQAQIKVRVTGLASLLITPAIRVGVGVSLEGELIAAEGEISATGKVGSSQELGWQCANGICEALDHFEKINEFKFKAVAPSIYGMHVTAGAHAFILLGLDLVFLEGLGSAQIVEARLGPKQTVDFGRMEDQAERPEYASDYALKVEGVVQPGAALAEAIKKSVDSDSVGVRFKGSMSFPPEYSSPKGTLEVSRSVVPLGESVDFAVRLAPETVDYAVVGYNVASIQLWRKKEDEDEFKFWHVINVTAANQTTFTYQWVPEATDVGKSKFAAFATTVIPAEPYLEVADDSVKEVTVACFSSGVNRAVSRDASTLAPNTCSRDWTGNSSSVADGAVGFDSFLTWAVDDTFRDPGNPGLVGYRARGTTTVNHILWNGLGCSVDPTQVTFTGSSDPTVENNLLVVDYSVTPNTYVIHASKTVMATIHCPGADDLLAPLPVTAVSHSGNVSDDGTRIEASGQTPQGRYSYLFSRP